MGAGLFFARNHVAGFSRCGKARFSSVPRDWFESVRRSRRWASESGSRLSDGARSTADLLGGGEMPSVGGFGTGSRDTFISGDVDVESSGLNAGGGVRMTGGLDFGIDPASASCSDPFR